MRSIALALVVLPAVASAVEPALLEAGDPIEGADPAIMFDPTEPAPGQGAMPPAGAFIVNGTEATANEFPETVYLEIEGLTGRESSCTGSLIHPEWVLTAAHCTDGGQSPDICKVTQGNADPGDLADQELLNQKPDITVHFTNQFPANGGDQVSTIRLDTICHPDWVGEVASQANGFQGDVALLHLSTPQPLRPIMAVNDAPMDNSWVGTAITFIGFGITSEGGSGGGTKRYAPSPIVAIPDGRPHLMQNRDRVSNRSTCQGDSGGPGVLFTGGGYSQVSVTSHGTRCGDGTTGHMRVDHYLEWILENGPPTVETRPSAPPDYLCSHRLLADDKNSKSVGTTPMELACVVDFFAPETIEKVTWRWGDGGEQVVTEADGDGEWIGDHTYTAGGRYSVEACIEYLPHEDEDPIEHCVSRTDQVQACGIPDVGFQVMFDEGLTYDFLNTTDLDSSYGCINDLAWDIYEGEGTSGTKLTDEPIRSWEPTYTFDRAGVYTAVLHVGGIGGTGAAELTFSVGGFGTACNTSGGLPAGGVLLLGLGLVGLRRRR